MTVGSAELKSLEEKQITAGNLHNLMSSAVIEDNLMKMLDKLIINSREYDMNQLYKN